ncbi:hypothetical protein AOB60_23510 [Streptomyces noursei]|uniref:Uncharacterized protein n=2 Tax=Streptomyces TaxID=1883 RepID=A0A2N8P8J1_STRNR|nr:hypothetical protein AOB60_23510 [Streptomyces noursei]
MAVDRLHPAVMARGTPLAACALGPARPGDLVGPCVPSCPQGPMRDASQSVRVPLQPSATASKRPHSWEPADVTHALDALCVSTPGLEAEVDQRVVHRAARRLRHFYERLAPVVGDREAALAVLAATDLLFHPVYFDGENSSSGQYLLSRFTTALLGLDEEADDGE